MTDCDRTPEATARTFSSAMSGDVEVMAGKERHPMGHLAQ